MQAWPHGGHEPACTARDRWGSRSPATGEIPRRRPAQTATSNVPSKARVTSSDPSDRGPEPRCRNHGLRRGRESHGTYRVEWTSAPVG